MAGVEHNVDELGEWLQAGYPRAYRTAWLITRNHADAEEVVQDAYLRVWRFRDAIPASDGRDGWLYRVVVNAALSKLRADRNRRTQTDDSELETLADRGEDPAELATRSALADRMLSALADLPESLRIPLVLRYYVGLSEKEIAVAIQRRPGTVKSRLHEARARLSADPALAAWADRPAAGPDAESVTS